jgi:hypothetical protein
LRSAAANLEHDAEKASRDLLRQRPVFSKDRL